MFYLIFCYLVRVTLAIIIAIIEHPSIVKQNLSSGTTELLVRYDRTSSRGTTQHHNVLASRSKRSTAMIPYRAPEEALS